MNISRKEFDRHETIQNNNPSGEENMDRWNNYKGRDIAREIKKEYHNWNNLPQNLLDDIIAEKVIKKMRKNELIVNPNDTTKKFNAKKSFLLETINITEDDFNNILNNKINDTGYAAPIEWSNLGGILGQAIKNNDKTLNDLIKYYSRLFNDPSSIMSAQAYENEKLFNDVVNKYYPNLKYSTGLENGHWVTINGNHVFLKDKK